jgi:multiple sugar transport system substrate-binding protein
MDSRHQRLSRRSMLRAMGAAALLPVAAPLAACGGDGANSGDSTLTFVYYGDAQLQKSYTTLFKQFSDENPHIKLRAQGIPGDSWAGFANAVATRIAGGQPLDVVQIATEGQRIFASKGLLEPLDPYVKKDQAAVDDYFKDVPEALKKWTDHYAASDGKTYYIPGSYNTVAMHVNTDLFTKAGLEVPTDEWSWDDLRSAAEVIKKKTGAYIMPAGNSYFAEVMPWLLTNGASPIDADWKTATFDTPAAIEAAEFVRSLVVDGLAPKPGGTFDAATLMRQGKLACMAGGRWLANGLRTVKFVDPVTLVRFPQKTQTGTPLGWDAWPILKQSKNKDAAWTLIKFFMSKKFGDALVQNGTAAVPARASVATSAAFLENAPKNTELLSSILDESTPIPGPDRGAETQAAIEEAWLAAVSGTKDPATALGEANAKLEQLL